MFNYSYVAHVDTYQKIYRLQLRNKLHVVEFNTLCSHVATWPDSVGYIWNPGLHGLNLESQIFKSESSMPTRSGYCCYFKITKYYKESHLLQNTYQQYKSTLLWMMFLDFWRLLKFSVSQLNFWRFYFWSFWFCLKIQQHFLG